MPQTYHFKNLRLLDPRHGEVRPGYEVLVADGLIQEVVDGALHSDVAEVIDCGGKVLLPGLIDAHAHVCLSEVNIRRLEAVPLTLMTAHAAKAMLAMLNRGFTTVRDPGGADWGIKSAVEEGLIPGPRLFIAGQAIGPTGGHSDPRRRTDTEASCHCANAMRFTIALADGPDEVRKAAREQLRQGADHVKIMVSGGVASPYDPLDSLQFSLAEIQAAVEEAHAFGRYALAHAYTPEAITRAVNSGVRTIEHGNLIDSPTTDLMARRGAFLVANLVAYYAMRERAAEFGMTPEMLAKNDLVIDGGLRSLELCKQAGVEVGFGSDLLGQLQSAQSEEFIYRSEVLSPLEIFRQATLVGARIVRQEGRLGVIEPGAHADLLVMNDDPLANLRLFLDQGAHMPAIMTRGEFHKLEL